MTNVLKAQSFGHISQRKVSVNVATMSILEHNFSVLTNHDAAAHNSNKTAVLINHSIKESDFFFMIARLGIFQSQMTKTILCLNRKEAWEKKSRKAGYAVLRGRAL